MQSWELLKEKRGEFGPWLRRAFWLPLRGMLRMFHILPVCAALVVFVLLATDGQLREIYMSYMEDLGGVHLLAPACRLAAAAFAFALVSGVLYQAHYSLSTARMAAAYSSTADLNPGARLRRVREAAAIVLALTPWLGLFAGLLNAKVYLAYLFTQLQAAGATDLGQMQHVPMPGPLAIVAGVLVLGFVLSLIVVTNPKSRGLQRSIIVVTPPTAALLFLLLATSPQTNPSTFEIIETCAALCGVTAIYYLVYERLHSMRALVFSRTLQQGTGVNLRRHYRLLLFIWALLPWIGAVGLYFLVRAPQERNGLHSWAMIPIAMSWVISLGLFVIFLLHRYRERAELARWIYGSVAALAIAGLLMSRLPADTIVPIYRAIGPLASMAFGLLFLISVLGVLAMLSQRSGFPALTLVILALVGSVLVPLPIGWAAAVLAALCLVIFFVAAAARLGAVACVAVVLALTGGINYAETQRLQIVNPRSTVGAATLQVQFDSWIKRAKSVPATDGPVGTGGAAPSCAARLAGKPYPVFIIAATGGGIYAASAASMLLARLQDQDPCFAQHVFAISGVSGGAIGTAIFQAVEQAPPEVRPPDDASQGCLPPSTNQKDADPTLEIEVCSIIQDDHFSPLVASIFPEFLGFTANGRAQELAASFERSVGLRNPAAAKILDEPFDKYAGDWSKTGTGPAPVLNATWVESGYRVAFAPFPLHTIDGSLYSFVDQSMPDDAKLTFLKAAVVSARFPAVLPPYSVLIRKDLFPSAEGGGQTNLAGPKSTEKVRWNFVDGGYSDTTGAATALAIYKALARAAKADGVVLRVILLTSSDPQLKPGDINGTAFADTLGPINAMLSVRDGLGNEAVARACDGILGASAACNGSPGEDLSSTADSPLQIVGIEDQNYGLSLGWKISQTTFGVVSWMLGEPQFVNGDVCKRKADSANPSAQKNGQFTLNENVVCANSRVQQDVLQALR